jgi:4'-phosphopantetheinyl transferase
MIHWLVQSTDSYPDNGSGVVVWDDVLHPREQAQFTTLKTEKRRRDWLLGRWTAKQLVGEVIAKETGVQLPPDVIEVHNGMMGDPILNCQLPIVNCKRIGISGESPILRQAQDEFSNLQSLVTLSISHSNSHAFCALVEKSDWPLGADMEQIAPRSGTFVTDYFTKEEQSLVAQTSAEMRDVVITAVWSAKEAVLKALHLGLTVDTRSVACLIQPVGKRPFAWTPFTIQCDDSRLPHSSPPLMGWWRTYDDFVLTLVVQEAEEPIHV